MKLRVRLAGALASLLAVITMVPLVAAPAQAAPIPRSLDEAIIPLTEDAGGPLLFKLDYWLNRPKDNLIEMVAGAARQRGVLQKGGHSAKHFWTMNFDSTSDEFVWTVEVSRATRFNVRLNMSSGPGDQFVLDVPGTSNALRFGATAQTNMERVEPGQIVIPAGRHELRLRKSRTAGFNSSVQAIELIRSSDYAAYQERVADFKADTSWMRGKKGYMVQWGAWSYPAKGRKGSYQDVWNSFDVNKFVDEMVKTKVDYVVWSVSWIDYLFPGPNRTIDSIMGPDGDDRTADRDLLMEIGRGLRARGIDLAIYYHVGHGSRSWWDKQNWPYATFNKNAYGDRSTFFNNWKSVVGEMGRRYGSLIKGFFFDDASAYYPADFEDLAAAARTGNPNRFISYNNYLAPSSTDFQDVAFGEVYCTGQTDFDGHLIDGRNKGLLQHCMKRVHNHWGSYIQDWANPGYVLSPAQYQKVYDNSTEQGAISISNIMFNGPTFVDRNRDGSVGDGNANIGATATVPKRYVTDIAVGKNGALFGQSERVLYTADAEGNWRSSGTRGDKFGVQRNGSVYALDRGNLIRNGSVNLGNDGYTITTISVGADGSVYGLTDTGELIRWTQGRWRSIATNMTGLTALSVGKDYNNVWLLDASGKPFHFNGSRVSSYVNTTTLRFKQVEAAPNGDLFAIATDGSLYQWRNRAWTKRTEVDHVSDVAATSHGDFWFIDADNHWIGHYDGSDTIVAVRSIVR